MRRYSPGLHPAACNWKKLVCVFSCAPEGLWEGLSSQKQYRAQKRCLMPTGTMSGTEFPEAGRGPLRGETSRGCRWRQCGPHGLALEGEWSGNSDPPMRLPPLWLGTEITQDEDNLRKLTRAGPQSWVYFCEVALVLSSQHIWAYPTYFGDFNRLAIKNSTGICWRHTLHQAQWAGCRLCPRERTVWRAGPTCSQGSERLIREPVATLL